MTPHIEALREEIAKIVIMPGDPKRAQFIAETYLEKYEKVNEVRGMLAFTGYYKGQRVTIMASGMGMPSIGIYAYELYKFYDVDTIIRVGSAGAFDPSLSLYDIVLADEAYSDSSFAFVQSRVEDKMMKPTSILNDEIIHTAEEMATDLHVGRIYSSDVFYKTGIDPKEMFKEGNIATEMESFALFHTANLFSKNAAALFTISDHFITGEKTTAEEREKAFGAMILLALETVAKKA
ncbi:MAG: purine-nucleoside phosphorylase [Bacilli bacterium]|nr:purine-nucleoside phosphorylase [Bacilli bacterium]